MYDNQRIEQLKKYLGVSANALAKVLELPNPQIFYDIKAGKCGISKELAAKIKDKFLNISAAWLLTGEGEMIKSPQPQQPLEDMPTYLKAENKELKAENKELNKQIGRLTGINEMLQKQIEELKKTAALKEEDAKCAHVAISHLESIAIK